MANRVQMGKAFVVVGAENAALFKALNNAEKRVARFGAKVGQAAQGFAKLGAAILIPFALASRAGLEFEKRMVEVLAVTGATQMEFQKLEDTARSLGAATSFTATEVGEAMAQLGRAGFSANEIISAIPTTLNLARASGLGMGEVAEIMADVSRTFGIAAGNITRVADAITFTANNATTNIEQLGEAITKVGPAAAAVGQKLETVIAALGLIANRGIKASEAGTSLQAVLLRLADVNVQDTIEDLGVSVRDAGGGMRDFTKILAELDQKLAIGGEIERLGILSELFGRRGLKAATNIASLTDELAVFKEGLRNAQGITKTTADIMEGKFNKSLNLAKSAFEALQITITKAVQPTFQAWLKTLKNAFNEISQFVKKNGDLVVTLAKVGGAAIILAAGLGTLALAAKAVSLAMGAGAGLASAAAFASVAMKSFNTTALIASVTSASSLVPSITGASNAFKALTISSIASKLALLKFKAAVALGILGPFIAAAAIIGATVVIFLKLRKLLADNAALIETQNETDKLTASIRDQNRAIQELNKAKGLGQSFTSGAADKEIKERILDLKNVGKTGEEVTKNLENQAKQLTKLVAAEFDKRGALSKKNFAAAKNENRLLLAAIQTALAEDLANTLKTEQQIADGKLRIRLDILTKTKELEKKFFQDQIGRAQAAAVAEDEAKFQKRLKKDPGGEAAELDAQIKASSDTLEKKRREANDALVQSRKAPTRENAKAAQAAIDSFKGEQNALDILVNHRKQAAGVLINLAKQEKDRLETGISGLGDIEARISASMDVNRFVDGAKSQFSELTDEAQDFLKRTLVVIESLKSRFAAGLIDEDIFKQALEVANQGVSEALSARRGKGGRSKDSFGSFGTFSGREAAGAFGRDGLQIATASLKTLRQILKVVKQSGGATFSGGSQ